MAKVVTDDKHYKAIAEVIRNRSPISDNVKPEQMADCIDTVADESWMKGYASGGDGIIERSVTEITSNANYVGQYAFFLYRKMSPSQGSLEKINLPNAIYIDDYAFNGCSSLKTVNIPNVRRIDADAFSGCSSLTALDLKVDSGEKIYSRAFNKCTSLKTLILRQTERMFELEATDVFANTPIAQGTGYIYVPRNKISTYLNQTNWSAFADRFRIIEYYTNDGTVTGEFDYEKI